jgi:hypothetical protein
MISWKSLTQDSRNFGEYRGRLVGPRGRDYVINVAGNKNGVGYGAWTHIDGWSEAVVEYIRSLEQMTQT